MLMEANKVMRKGLILMTVCAVAVLAAPRAHAACGFAVPVGNAQSAYIAHCPDGSPVTAYTYAIDAPTTINSANLDIACEALGGSCAQVLPQGNVAGDGWVTIETDWSTPGYIGCAAGHRVVIVLQCNDGSGVKFSLSGNDSGFGYQLELAFDCGDVDCNFVNPLDLKQADGVTPAFNNGRPRVSGLSRSGGNDVVNVNVPVSDLKTDCDPGTLGEIINIIDGDQLGCSTFTKNVGRGRLFRSTQPCTPGSRPTLALAAWTLDPAVLGPTGDTQVTIPTAAAGQCNYLGSTSVISGLDSNTIDGYVAVAGAGAASPKAESVRAARAGNSINVSFSTSSELGLAGFNVLTGSKGKGEIKLNAALISGKGIGGAGSTYTLSFPVADFKGGRNITVESVLNDGTTLRSASVNF